MHSVVEFANEALASRIARLHELAPAARAQDADGIHDLRVASRRLRAALKVIGKALTADAERELSHTAAKITRLLGRPRELDVMLHMLGQERERAAGPWRDAIDAAIAAVRARRDAENAAVEETAALAETLTRSPGAIDPARATSLGDLDAHRDALLARAKKKLVKRHRKWKRHPDGHALHAVRVAFKKYRYTCETLLPVAPHLEPHIEEIKAIQQSLGDWNDCRILVHELEDLDLTDPSRAAQSLVVQSFTHRANEYLHAFELQTETFFGHS